jgi:hypothetical protein
MDVNADSRWLWKELAVIHFNVLLWHLPGGTHKINVFRLAYLRVEN